MEKMNTVPMKMICTLGIQCQIFGTIWTLKHHRVLDLPHQQLQEVQPGCFAVPEAAGKCSLLLVFEPGQGRHQKKKNRFISVSSK